MRAAQIAKPGGEFEVVEREIPEPDADAVLVKVQACGVCHSDVFVKEGLWPGLQYPRVPGHQAPIKRRGRTPSSRARGAEPQAVHGPPNDC